VYGDEARARSEARADTALDHGERVETLLIELSARLISLAPEHVDREIQDAQRRICDYLGFDRSSLFQQPVDDPDALLLTHVHQRPGMPPPPLGKLDAAAVFPWMLEQLRQGKTIAVSKLDDLPAEGAPDKESCLRFGTRSVVAVPLPIGSGMLGAVTFASARERGDWAVTTVKRFQLVAEVFGNVIKRAMIVAKGPKLWIESPGKAATLTPRLTMEEVEREQIRRVLEMTGLRVRGKNGAAETLGVRPTTLESRMARLGIYRRAEDRTK
jgi:GAF domain-containing protein